MKWNKRHCEDCKDLPEGDVKRGHNHRMTYDMFIRDGYDSGFTDEQMNFLEKWFGDEIKN